jgi:2-amino-4-hydroxy-6-hydroxymethyldihydropteridine diphosphokinase
VSDVFLGLGANEGDRESNIKTALDMLNQTDGIFITAVSSIYETKSLSKDNQPDYLNCVIRIDTDLDPHALLDITQSIEAALGRESGAHMLPRPMDIDILLYDDTDLQSEHLMIPHSRLKARRFVLEPLLEIDPDAVDPQTSRPLKESLAKVHSQEVRKFKDRSEVWDV